MKQREILKAWARAVRKKTNYKIVVILLVSDLSSLTVEARRQLSNFKL